MKCCKRSCICPSIQRLQNRGFNFQNSNVFRSTKLYFEKPVSDLWFAPTLFKYSKVCLLPPKITWCPLSILLFSKLSLKDLHLPPAWSVASRIIQFELFSESFIAADRPDKPAPIMYIFLIIFLPLDRIVPLINSSQCFLGESRFTLSALCFLARLWTFHWVVQIRE